MIGIQINQDKCWGAVWTDMGEQVIGSASTVDQVVKMARVQGIDCNSVVVAVPAWYNDEQRRQVQKQTKSAGAKSVRLVNEPSAATYAYGITQPELPGITMVLQISPSGAFDVTILKFEDGRVEIVATNGMESVGNKHGSVLFNLIQPVVDRALSDAGIRSEALDAILLTGETPNLRTIASEIQAAWQLAPAEPPNPETAIACGAAIYGGFLSSMV